MMERALSQAIRANDGTWIYPNKPEPPDWFQAAVGRRRELRAAEGLSPLGGPAIVGRAIYWGDLGGPISGDEYFTFEPGAFLESIEERFIFACDGHSDAQDFADNRDGTLRLGEDGQGLWFEIRQRPDPFARLVFGAVAGEGRRQVSIGFVPVEFEFRGSREARFCQVRRAHLLHVALTNTPAFKKTWVKFLQTPSAFQSPNDRMRKVELEAALHEIRDSGALHDDEY